MLLARDYVIQSVGVKITNLSSVTLQIDGILEASVHNESWPQEEDGSSLIDLLSFEDCFNLTIKGEGMVDGLGYDWWIREWNRENKNGRPNLLNFYRV